MRRLAFLTAGVTLTFALAACGDDAASEAPGGSLTVFAAASLSDAFAEVTEAFEAAHGDVSVELSFAGSSSLREQILGGAPADVFASADTANMDRLAEAGEVEAPEVFARNRLQIVVPAGNPAGVEGLDDFADPALLIGLCAEEVPCGHLGREVLEAAGVTPSPDTDEPDVRALLTKVEAGELDAGLVYVTDVVAAGDAVQGIDVPAELDVAAAYPIAATTGAGHPVAARSFIEFVLGAEGQAILERSGFERP